MLTTGSASPMTIEAMSPKDPAETRVGADAVWIRDPVTSEHAAACRDVVTKHVHASLVGPEWPHAQAQLVGTQCSPASPLSLPAPACAVDSLRPLDPPGSSTSVHHGWHSTTRIWPVMLGLPGRPFILSNVAFVLVHRQQRSRPFSQP